MSRPSNRHNYRMNQDKQTSHHSHRYHSGYAQYNDIEWTKRKRNRKETDKEYYRKEVWEYMEYNNISRFPRPVYHRIPNFVNAQNASMNLMKIKEFVNSKLVKCNPDKPQEYVRYLCLEMNKKLFIPTPQLRSNGLLNEIRIPSNCKINEEILHMASTRKGLKEFGHLLSLNDLLHWKHKFNGNTIDIVIVGSVAVDEMSGYRIGKGEGYCDIEIAIMNEFGLIDEHTIFIATVHDCQVYYNELDQNMFDNNHDVILDYIVTPTRVIKLDRTRESGKLKYKIDWNKLSVQQMNKIPVLRQLKMMKQAKQTNVKHVYRKVIKRW